MVHHFVMFDLKDFAEGSPKSENAAEIKKILMSLPDKINQINDYEVFINQLDSERSADLILVSTFESWKDLDIYIEHPEHKKAVEFIKPRRNGSKSLDCEM